MCEGSHLADPVSLPVSRAPKDPWGLLPSSPESLPWHEVGTRPGWASGAGLASFLLVLILGAQAPGVPWARAPRPPTAHAPLAHRCFHSCS